MLEHFGRIDILVNAAELRCAFHVGLCGGGLAGDSGYQPTGTLRACQVFGRTMVERKYGRIVNIASLATFVAFRDVAAYGASKAGVGALTKSLAVELRGME